MRCARCCLGNVYELNQFLILKAHCKQLCKISEIGRLAAKWHIVFYVFAVLCIEFMHFFFFFTLHCLKPLAVHRNYQLCFFKTWTCAPCARSVSFRLWPIFWRFPCTARACLPPALRCSTPFYDLICITICIYN